MFKSLKQFAKKMAGGSKRTRKVSQKGGDKCAHQGDDKVLAKVASVSEPSKMFEACGKTMEIARKKATQAMQTYEQEKAAKKRAEGSKFRGKLSGTRVKSAYNEKVFIGTKNGKTAEQRAREYNIQKSGLSDKEYNNAFKLGATNSSANTHYKHTELGAIRHEASKIKSIKNKRQGTTQEMRNMHNLPSYNLHYGTLHNAVTNSAHNYGENVNNQRLYNKNRKPLSNLSEYETQKMKEYALHGAISRRGHFNPKSQQKNYKLLEATKQVEAEQAAADLSWTMEGNQRALLNETEKFSLGPENEKPWQRELRLMQESKMLKKAKKNSLIKNKMKKMSNKPHKTPSPPPPSPLKSSPASSSNKSPSPRKSLSPRKSSPASSSSPKSPRKLSRKSSRVSRVLPIMSRTS